MNLNLTKYLAHKKHTNLIFAACDDKYAFCLYVSLSTLQENSPRLAQSADIYVAGYGLSDKSKEILNSLPHTRVVDYTYPTELPDTEQIRKFTAASFARYDCFALLKHYEKILYLDSDVLVQKEILPVFDEVHDGVGLITDSTFSTVRRQFFAPIQGFNMERVGFNSGFLVLTNKSNWAEKGEEITRWMYEQTQKLAKELFLPDQGIINLAINLTRLKGENRENFRRRFMMEYQEEFNNNGIKRDCFSSQAWLKMMKMLAPSSYKWKLFYWCQKICRPMISDTVKNGQRIWSVCFGLIPVKRVPAFPPNFMEGAD